MALFEWTPKYSVGVSRYDREHQVLFDLINKLHDTLRIGQERSVLDPLFNKMMAYTEQHLAGEEAAMALYGYPQAEAHKAEHDVLRRELASLEEKYRAGTSKIGIDVLNFLLRWWTDHILHTDKQYSGFFAARAIQVHRLTQEDSGETVFNEPSGPASKS